MAKGHCAVMRRHLKPNQPRYVAATQSKGISKKTATRSAVIPSTLSAVSEQHQSNRIMLVMAVGAVPEAEHLLPTSCIIDDDVDDLNPMVGHHSEVNHQQQLCNGQISR